MAATPYKGVIETMTPNGTPGPAFRFSGSDVAAAFVTFDDLPGTPSQVTIPQGLVLADVKVSAAGVDTKAFVLTRGTTQTDHILRHAPLVETLALSGQQRLGRLYGQPLQPGAQYGLKQLA